MRGLGRAAVGVAALSAAAVAAFGAVSAGAAEEGLCAFRVSTERQGLTATATFRVVRDNCEVSFVSIEKLWDGNGIVDTATGVFAKRDAFYTLSVRLPCGVNSETDLVLGPPVLYPPREFDLGATPFHVPCPGGGGGGGGGTPLPGLSVVVSAPVKSVRRGSLVTITYSVRNSPGAGSAQDVHLLITVPANSVQRGAAVADRGSGCVGTAVIDCSLGDLAAGAGGSVRVRYLAAGTGKLFFFARTDERQPDANPADNSARVTLPIVLAPVKLRLSATRGRILAGEQIVFVKLSMRARVSAQVYVSGVAQKTAWRRTLPAGTTIARVRLPKLAKGQRFTLVLRATAGARKTTVKLRLKA